jgi:hypothetical protein|tara:strand:- start:507 stop:692 length:186 start_codon:yes stop_codon:yes gene_type:complete
MKIHESAIKELVRIFQVHGGHREEWRLINELSKIDLTAYSQQRTGNDILVLSKDIKKALQK